MNVVDVLRKGGRDDFGRLAYHAATLEWDL